jgi:hypothetical protein
MKNAKDKLDDLLRREQSQEIFPAELDEEIFHLQADGFWGPEKGFHHAEQLRRQ